jgi:ABC-type bacteriocin/lantibiotic exporter with double-glycine peptidase domain
MEIMNWDKVKKKIDNLWVGVGLGFILFMLGFLLSKFVKDKQGSYTLEGFWNLLVGQNSYYLEILTFSLLPNMLAFYLLFFQWKMDKAVRGLIFSTIIILGSIMVLH